MKRAIADARAKRKAAAAATAASVTNTTTDAIHPRASGPAEAEIQSLYRAAGNLSLGWSGPVALESSPQQSRENGNYVTAGEVVQKIGLARSVQMRSRVKYCCRLLPQFVAHSVCDTGANVSQSFWREVYSALITVTEDSTAASGADLSLQDAVHVGFWKIWKRKPQYGN